MTLMTGFVVQGQITIQLFIYPLDLDSIIFYYILVFYLINKINII